jgi:glycosyltransferase involved in cell wall biosynthesis
MKVGIIARRGNFKLSSKLTGLWGYSVQRYISILCDKLIKNSDNYFSVEKIELGKGSSTLSRRTTLFFDLTFYNMRNFNILHAPTPLPIKPVRIGVDTKVITTSHGMHSVDRDGACYNIERENQRIIDKILGHFGEHGTLNSDYIIAVSSLTKKRAVDLGFSSKKVFVVNIGIDDKFINTPKTISKVNKNFVVGYLGPMYKRKNVIFAIDAFKKIKDQEIRFNVWGKKAYDYPNLIKARGGDKRISFMGIAPEHSLVSTYDTFDVFVYPTLCDQFPASLLEAQSRGIPVITFKHGEISNEARKYCIEAEDEYDMARIIEKIMRNGYSNKIRLDAMKYARSFTANKLALETMKVYKKVYNS